MEELKVLLGKGRAKKGIFEGDLAEGELEIGQVSALIHRIEPVSAIMERMISGFNTVKEKIIPDSGVLRHRLVCEGWH